MLTTELYWLVVTLMMTALFWVPTIINRIIEQGAWTTLAIPQLHPEASWAQRLMRAHNNAVENLVIFAPLILMINITGANAPITGIVSMVYFIARCVHVIAYIFAVPVLRTLAFAIGVFCQLTLALRLLTIV